MKVKEKRTLIIFAREPEAGKVKTRLLSDLPSHVVSKLYKAFLKDLIPMTKDVNCQERIIFFYRPQAAEIFIKFWQRFFFPRTKRK